MLALTRPKFFLPVHGEHRMLVKHSETARSMGVPATNMVIINNGDVVELTQDNIRVAGTVPSGIELVNASCSSVVNERVLKERQQLAADGVITIAAAIGANGQLLVKPEIHLRGVASAIEKPRLEKLAAQTIDAVLSDRWEELTRSFGNEPVEVEWEKLKAQVETELRRMLRRELQSNPPLVFLMQTQDRSLVQSAIGQRPADRVAS
jgi:ribonuclease J